MLEAQICVYLSIKALLDKLGISPKTRDGRILHDVSDKVPEAYEKPKQFPQDLKEHQVMSIRVEFLTSIREHLEYGAHWAVLPFLHGNLKVQRSFMLSAYRLQSASAR